MAISIALPTNGKGSDPTNTTSYATLAVPLVAGRDYVMGIRLARSGATPDTSITVSGTTSGTWGTIGGRSYNPSGASQRSRVYGKYLHCSASVTEVLTIGVLSAAHLNCAWVIGEITGSDTAAAIPYASNSGANSADAQTSGTVVLAAVGNVANATIGIFGTDIAGAVSAGNGGTILDQVAVETEGLSFWYKVGGGDPTITMASADYGVAGFEIAALLSGGASLPLQFFTRDV